MFYTASVSLFAPVDVGWMDGYGFTALSAHRERYIQGAPKKVTP